MKHLIKYWYIYSTYIRDKYRSISGVAHSYCYATSNVITTSIIALPSSLDDPIVYTMKIRLCYKAIQGGFGLNRTQRNRFANLHIFRRLVDPWGLNCFPVYRIHDEFTNLRNKLKSRRFRCNKFPWFLIYLCTYNLLTL